MQATSIFFEKRFRKIYYAIYIYVIFFNTVSDDRNLLKIILCLTNFILSLALRKFISKLRLQNQLALLIF